MFGVALATIVGAMVWGLFVVDRKLRDAAEGERDAAADFLAAHARLAIRDLDSSSASTRSVAAAVEQGLSVVSHEPRIVAVSMSPADTVFVVRDPAGGSELATVHREVSLPDGRQASIIISSSTESAAAQMRLWVVGGLGILLLGIGIARERYQSLQVAARSADIERLSVEALRANAMKSEFLANVSHELRTPLTAIVGFVEMLRDGVYGELAPRQVGPVDRIAASATHLRHLVDQILDIARIAAGRLEVTREVISLRPYVLNIASELESLFNERSLRLSISVPATLPKVRTDPTHLRHVLVNLLGNAVKYTPAGGVAVRARLVPDDASPRRTPGDPLLASAAPDPEKVWVALQVVDTGVGIAERDRERIFDEFEQVNAGPRTDSVERGTGLGLAISRRLARSLGGDITVESQVGKGSTFTMWIPVDPADLAARGPRMSPSTTPAESLTTFEKST